MMRPLPRLAAWLLRVSVPERWSDSVIGDFEADWPRQRRAWPRSAAARVTLEAARFSTRMLMERTVNLGDAVARDVRESMRALRRRPSYALAAIGVIALGVGLHTTAFAVVDRVLLTPLPYPQSEQLMELRARQPDGTESATVSSVDLEAWAEGLTGVASIGGYQVEQAGVLAPGQPLPVDAPVAHVTPPLLGLLGVPVAVGRPFSTPDGTLGTPGVAIVAAHTWRNLFPEADSPLGASFRIAGQSYTVVGVAPAGSQFPEGVGIWLARETAAARLRGLGIEFASMRAIARISGPATAADVARLGADAARSRGRAATPLAVPLHESIVGSAARVLRLAWAGVALLFLIACANAAGLLLSRIAARGREFEMRAALGASRAAILRHAAIDAVLIAVAGAVPGLALAAALLRLIASAHAGQVPLSSGLGLSASSVLFTVGLVALASAFVSGAAAAALARARPRSSATGGLMVALQLALCAALVVSAALTGGGLWRELARHPGFNHEQLLVLSARPNAAAAQGSTASAYQPLLDRLAAVDGVAGIAMSDHLPPASHGRFAPVIFEGELAADARLPVRVAGVTPAFFRTLEIPIVAGRSFTDQEAAAASSVAVVDERLALRAGGADGAVGSRAVVNGQVVEIIGVAGRVAGSSRDAGEETLYRPLGSGVYRTGGATFLTELQVVLRYRQETAGAVSALKAALTTAPVPLEFTGLTTMENRLRAPLAGQRFRATMFGAIAVMGAGLSALGVYALVSHLVQRSTRDLCVRIALGASPGDVVRLVVRRGLMRAGAGAALGVVATPAIASLVASRLDGAAAASPWLFAAVVAALSIVVVTGSAVPAWRATRVDPVTTLKCE